jgi:hypothetical protein
MISFIDVQQNTDDWIELRAKRLTSSKLGVVMANYGKPFGDPAKRYATDIAVEQITGLPTTHGYSNDHMERGHEEEPIARMLYEEEMFCDVTNGGFFKYGDFIGCSPDGLIGDKGVCEIKSVIPSVHYKNVSRGGIDPAYKWQCIGNILFTGREWLDFISYCGTFPEGKKLFVCRTNKSSLTEEFEMIKARIDQFKNLVGEVRNKIESSDYFIKQQEAA